MRRGSNCRTSSATAKEGALVVPKSPRNTKRISGRTGRAGRRVGGTGGDSGAPVCAGAGKQRNATAVGTSAWVMCSCQRRPRDAPLYVPRGKPGGSQAIDPVLAPLEGGVEGDARLREVQPPREARGLARAVLAVHHRVLPLDRQRALVAGVVELAHQGLEVDAPAAGRAEVPEASVEPEVGVAAEDADGRTALAPPDVLDVHVEDALAELAQEGDVVDALVAHVRGVEVEAEVGDPLDGFERAARAVDVEGDLGRMHLEREADADLVELLQDRRPPGGEVAVAGLDHVLRDRREGVEQVPDRRAREAVDDRAAAELQPFLHGSRRGVEEAARGLAGLDHLLRRALLDALGLAVAPDLG